jgi:hypothetical protein
VRLVICFSVALFTLARGDELILKDGKRIEWTDLHDAGDSYEVTTPQGTKITVKKDDVDSLAKKRAPELLTGAVITFDKKKKLESFDLLSQIDIKKDIVSGPWRMNGKSLSGGPGQAESISKLQISGFTTIPEDYDLTMTIEKKEATNGFFVVLIGGGRQFGVGFDTNKLAQSGFGTSSGNDVNEGRVIPGKFFGKGARTIKFMVRREAFVIQADGKDFITWKADWPKVNLWEMWAAPARNVFVVGLHDSSNYIVSSMVMSAPKN